MIELKKSELLTTLKKLLSEKQMYSIGDVNSNSSKSTIINAIKCLECDEEMMMDCLEILKFIYPNIYCCITSNGIDVKSFMYHPYQRLYVFNTVNPEITLMSL